MYGHDHFFRPNLIISIYLPLRSFAITIIKMVSLSQLTSYYSDCPVLLGGKGKIKWLNGQGKLTIVNDGLLCSCTIKRNVMMNL